MTKPPGCWLRWRGKPISVLRQLHPQPAHRRARGRSRFRAGVRRAPCGRRTSAWLLANASMRSQVDAQRPPHIAQRRARAVADDHAGERGAVAAVLAVDVLDDLFAALVLEVDVDVGRLVALGADEALEQQRGARRVDRGHAQAVADRRIGRAAAALAQDALARAQRTMSSTVRKYGSYCSCAISASSCSSVARHFAGMPCGKRCSDALLGELAQPARGRVAGGHDLARVLVAQLVQREGAAGRRCPAWRPATRPGRARPAAARAQVRLGIGLQRQAAFGHRRTSAARR